MYASMRNAELCAILHQTHFRNMQNLTELWGTARGANRTHKRTLAGAKLRHIESLQCRKNFVYSLKKHWIISHLL